MPFLGVGGPVYRDRRDAGERLAVALHAYEGRHPVILGIPRGGVPVAAEVARRLGGELDIIVARKLGAPGHRELAIGAVTADGGRFLNDEIMAMLGVAPEYLEQVTAAEMEEARSREERFRQARSPVELKGRTVILVDDGLATGATMIAAARSVRGRGPARLVIGVPVGASEACAALGAEADEVVCPARPEPFQAIGLHYADFDQVPDTEVIALLRDHALVRPA
jgi:predicted phosphoribosyltransferase